MSHVEELVHLSKDIIIPYIQLRIDTSNYDPYDDLQLTLIANQSDNANVFQLSTVLMRIEENIAIVQR
ncbi:MAG: hypothetical protein WBA77_04375 [Microcoleaceae cyanobacterium]